MKELNQIVTTKLAAMIDDGSIEMMIEERLESLMQDTIKSAMQSYSDFGKSLTKSIEDSIGTSLCKVSFPEYNHFVAQLVQEKYGQALDQHAAPLLEQLLKDALSPVPVELNAKEMLKVIKECLEESTTAKLAKEIEVHWYQTGTSICMKIFYPDYPVESLLITFYCPDDEEKLYQVRYINDSGKKIVGSISGATHAFGLAGYFYKLYCRQTKISGLKEFYGKNIEVADY